MIFENSLSNCTRLEAQGILREFSRQCKSIFALAFRPLPINTDIYLKFSYCCALLPIIILYFYSPLATGSPNYWKTNTVADLGEGKGKTTEIKIKTPRKIMCMLTIFVKHGIIIAHNPWWLKAAKYEIQKPSTCRTPLFRCKFWSSFAFFTLPDQLDLQQKHLLRVEEMWRADWLICRDKLWVWWKTSNKAKI